MNVQRDLIMNIKQFSVYGLFGTHDVKIPFDNKHKILIGENGIGKTQVLNLLYYTLKKDFFRLCDYEFDYLEIKFSNDDSLIIHKNKLLMSIEGNYGSLIEEFIEIYGFSELMKLRDDFEEQGRKISTSYVERTYNQRYKYLRLPIRHLLRELRRTFDNDDFLFVDEWKRIIDNYLGKTELMYFPTYRRVEEDINKITKYDDEYSELENNTLIQFGMADVQRKFNEIESTIDSLSKEGFAQFTKDILSIVVAEVENKENVLDKINEDNIDIILSRVGNLLTKEQKIAVKDAVLKKKFANPLSGYLLQKLSDIYEKQQKWDMLIKKFAEVCNKYLINKKVFYDESAIDIYIKSDINGNKIALEKLSSGEKQIISIFSKIYLSDKDSKFIVLFDEPELSLSIRWQELLLPDIVNSNKCELLLAVTHSPFIFDNALEDKAVALSTYINIIEK